MTERSAHTYEDFTIIAPYFTSVKEKAIVLLNLTPLFGSFLG